MLSFRGMVSAQMCHSAQDIGSSFIIQRPTGAVMTSAEAVMQIFILLLEN